MEKSIYDYPAVDFTPLLEPEKLFAVRCETEDEARHLIAAMMIQFPDKMKTWRSDETFWMNDNDGLGGGRAYYPDVNNAENEEFLHGDVDWAKENGFTVVQFSDLIVPDEPLEESDMALADLVGWLS